MSSPTILSHVTGVDGHLWEVKGSSDENYIVACDWDGWMCTCPDHYYRGSFCKHMKACQEYAESKRLMLHNQNRIFKDTLATEVTV